MKRCEKQTNKQNTLRSDTKQINNASRIRRLRVAFRKYRPTVGTSSKFDFAHFWENSFCPFGAQNPLPVKRNFTQIPLTRTSNHNDLAAFEEHE